MMNAALNHLTPSLETPAAGSLIEIAVRGPVIPRRRAWQRAVAERADAMAVWVR